MSPVDKPIPQEKTAEEPTRVQKTEEDNAMKSDPGKDSFGERQKYEEHSAPPRPAVAYVSSRALMRARKMRAYRRFLFVMRYNYNVYRKKLAELYEEHIRALKDASADAVIAENESYKNKLLLAGEAYKNASDSLGAHAALTGISLGAHAALTGISLGASAAAFADMGSDAKTDAHIDGGAELGGTSPLSYGTEEPITLDSDGYYVYSGEGEQPLEAKYPDPTDYHFPENPDPYHEAYPDPTTAHPQEYGTDAYAMPQYPDPEPYLPDAEKEYSVGAEKEATQYEPEAPEYFSLTEERERQDTLSEIKMTDGAYYVLEKTEQSVRVVEARMLYEIESMKHKHKMLAYTFTTDSYEKESSSRRIANGVDKRIKKLEKAKRLERWASKRYYLAATDKGVCSAARRAKRDVEINSVLTRMNFLLDERARINDRLLKLYTGSSKIDKKSYEVYANRKARRVARQAYKSQRRLARRIAKLHATVKIKEKIFELMNERTLEYAKIENGICRIRKGGKQLERVLKKDIKKSKKRIRYLSSDIRYFVKKAEKQDNKYRANKEQAMWLIGLLLAALVIGGVYFAFKSAIDAFFSSLFG